MNQRPLISVVIPTRNRQKLLELTLMRLFPQCEKHVHEVELIIADNSSEDNTKQWLLENFFDKNVTLHFFDESVDIDSSFLRSSRLAKGKFICIFGDDDYPFPGFIDAVLASIKAYPEIKFIHVARLIADSNMENPAVYRTDLGLDDKLMSVRDFIPKFDTNPGFITSLISRSEFWQSDSDFSDFDGYGFLARVYSQAINGDCVYIASPLIAMRKSQTLWKSDWPRYFLVSRQRLLFWLNEKYDLNIKINPPKVKNSIYNFLLAKATIYKPKDPFWDHALVYLPFHQKIICQAIRYLFPKSLATSILIRR